MTEGLTIKDKLEQLGYTEWTLLNCIFAWCKYADLNPTISECEELARRILALATDKPYV